MMSGRLRERIVIEHTVRTRDISTGEEIGVETRHIPTRAEVRYGGGGRSNDNGEIVYPYDMTFMVWLYIDKDLSDYDRITYRGESYIIISRERDDAGKLLYLKCRKDG